MNDLLIVAECVLFLILTVVLFRKERLYGFYFLFTLVYAIFSQIGYLYFPELSIYIRAYFGVEIWREATIFILLSGIALFVLLNYCSSGILKVVQSSRIYVHVDHVNSRICPRIVLVIFTATLMVQYYILITVPGSLTWLSVQQQDVFQQNLPAGVFMFLIKASLGSNIVLYSSMRQSKSFKNSRFLWFVGILSIASFIIFTLKVGSRGDISALLVGITLFETSMIRLRSRHLITIVILGCCFFGYLQFVEIQRDPNSNMESDLVSRLLLKDYYMPAHMLFAAISYDYINPSEVIKSNASNSLVMLRYPFLQMTITDLFLPGVATRSQGYAFYSLTEGYMVAGPAGFLYNGIILGGLLVFWRSLASTNSSQYNQFMLAIMACTLLGLVRGQSAYFIKDLYSFIFPGAVLYLGLTNQRLRLKVRRNPLEVNALKGSSTGCLWAVDER
jgi:hypothetical protein